MKEGGLEEVMKGFYLFIMDYILILWLYSFYQMLSQFYSREETYFNRLNLDYIKKNDLKHIFQILMSEPDNRTITDLNHLLKIILNIQPIKNISNTSAIYQLCKTFILAKFKEKSFIYQKQEDSEYLYIIISGKIGLYRRDSSRIDDQEVIFLSQGNSFGSAYVWKQKFLPLTFEETLLAIVPKRKIALLTVNVAKQREEMLKTIFKAKMFGQDMTEQKLRSVSHSFTLHRIPFGTYLIKQGQIPKVMFYLMKGSVKKTIEVKRVHEESLEVLQKKEMVVAKYSSGDYFPKQALSDCLSFNIIAESPCELITIPKKVLKMLGWSTSAFQGLKKNEDYYKEKISKQQQWLKFRSQILSNIIPERPSKSQKINTK